MAWEGSGRGQHPLIITIEAFINLILLAEVVIGILAEKKQYFHSWLNMMDFIMTILCIAFFIVYVSTEAPEEADYMSELDAVLLGCRFLFQLGRLSLFIYRSRSTNAILFHQEEIDFGRVNLAAILDENVERRARMNIQSQPASFSNDAYVNTTDFHRRYSDEIHDEFDEDDEHDHDFHSLHSQMSIHLEDQQIEHSMQKNKKLQGSHVLLDTLPDEDESTLTSNEEAAASKVDTLSYTKHQDANSSHDQQHSRRLIDNAPAPPPDSSLIYSQTFSQASSTTSSPTNSTSAMSFVAASSISPGFMKLPSTRVLLGYPDSVFDTSSTATELATDDQLYASSDDIELKLKMSRSCSIDHGMEEDELHHFESERGRLIISNHSLK